jgi:DNA-binding transcriptional LysR family regulator
MDFTALRYFFETAQSHSIRAASERLHVSPSAISRQIAKLEHELQAPIFDRRAQGMRLTAAGRLLQSRVEGMMREFDRIKSHIAALQSLQSGTVDVYCFQTAIDSFIAPVLHDFQARYPNVMFNVTMSSTDETIAALTTGAAEIGLILNPPVRDLLVNEVIFRDTIVAAVAPGHPLAGFRDVSLQQIGEYPLVLTERSFGLRQQVDKMLERWSVDVSACCVTNSLHLVKALASIGHQCALLPQFAVENEVAAGKLATVAVREFLGDPIVACVCTLNSRSVSPAARAFVDAIIRFCRRYGEAAKAA